MTETSERSLDFLDKWILSASLIVSKVVLQHDGVGKRGSGRDRDGKETGRIPLCRAKDEKGRGDEVICIVFMCDESISQRAANASG